MTAGRPRCTRCGRFVARREPKCRSCGRLRPAFDRLVNFLDDLNDIGVRWDVALSPVRLPVVRVGGDQSREQRTVHWLRTKLFAAGEEYTMSAYPFGYREDAEAVADLQIEAGALGTDIITSWVKVPVCRVCGCWDLQPCVSADADSCFWVAPDLCSQCHWPSDRPGSSIPDRREKCMN